MSARPGYGGADCRCDCDGYRPDTLGGDCDSCSSFIGKAAYLAHCWGAQRGRALLVDLIYCSMQSTTAEALFTARNHIQLEVT